MLKLLLIFQPQNLSTGDLLEISRKQIETSKLLKMDVKSLWLLSWLLLLGRQRNRRLWWLRNFSARGKNYFPFIFFGGENYINCFQGCYGITESGSIASTVSSASTEPWFCEPCRAGCTKPPDCELCPVIGGVYKETDVGRWVHLVLRSLRPRCRLRRHGQDVPRHHIRDELQHVGS